MGTLEKMTQIFNSANNGTKDIFFKFQPGTNHMRLVGDFVEMRVHYLSGNKYRNDRGLCPPSAFDGDGKIPAVFECANWDVSTGRAVSSKLCPICRLNKYASSILSSGRTLTEAQKKFFEALKASSKASTYFRWNIIDRDNPMITIVENGEERKVPGLKIATFTYSMMKSIFQLSTQFGIGLEDPDNGIDLDITKTDNNGQISYKVSPRYVGMQVKVSPLTAEERAFEVHNIIERCTHKTDVNDVLNALHGDIRACLDKFDSQNAPKATAPVQKQTADAQKAEQDILGSSQDTMSQLNAQSELEIGEGGSVLDAFPETNDAVQNDMIPF